MREDVRTNGHELLHCSFISQPKGCWGNWRWKNRAVQKGANFFCTLTASESVLLQQVALLSGGSVSHSGPSSLCWGILSCPLIPPLHGTFKWSPSRASASSPKQRRAVEKQRSWVSWFGLIWSGWLFFLTWRVSISGIWTERALQPACHQYPRVIREQMKHPKD